MNTSRYTSINDFQVQELDQIGLLPKPITYTSTSTATHCQQESTSESSEISKEGSTTTNKRALLYCLCFAILSIIILLDLAGHIGLVIEHRSNFHNNLQQIKIESTADKDNIIELNLAKAKGHQADSIQLKKQVMPSIAKVSDIILSKHVKQTINQKNNEQTQYLKKINLNEFLPAASPSANQEYKNEIVKQPINTIRSPELPVFQYPRHNPTNPPAQQSSINFFLQPPPTSSDNTFTVLIPALQSAFHQVNNDIGVNSPAVQANMKAPVEITTTDSAALTTGIDETQIQNAHMWKQLAKQELTINSEFAQAERKYYNDKHNILDYAELPFCIVVPTFNNVDNDRYLNNIRSILMQEYTNYHIVVIDDASTDDTGKLIAEFMQKQNKIPYDRYKVLSNSEQKMAMFNLRLAAVKFCKPQEIFMVVDGDDELLGRQVLHVFNAAFQKNQAWFVYSNFLGSNGYVGYSRPFPAYTMEENDYRKYPFVTSHLRAFYTQLFLNIREADLRDENGEYYHAANDVAISIPILQQAHKRVFYLPELTYLYNSNTGLNNHIVRLSEQKRNDHQITKKPKYSALTSLNNPA